MLVQKEVVLRAPVHLGVFQDRAPATLRFIARLRTIGELGGHTPVRIDFSHCKSISRAACLIITAELKRARFFLDGKLSFNPPNDPELADLFDAFGLYAYFRIKSPLSPSDRRERHKNSIVVRSGEAEPKQVKYKLTEIAAVAESVCFGNAGLAGRVDEALQEAMLNATHHAYAGFDATALPPDRWWFAGVHDVNNKDVLFYALDHGIGIPERAQQLMAPDLQAFWEADKRFAAAAGGKPSDTDLLEGAICCDRLDLAGREGRGKGLPTIVDLAKDDLLGEVRIYSGSAAWHRRGLKNAHPEASKSVDRCYPLRRKFPGTLICWRVGGPRAGYGETKQ